MKCGCATRYSNGKSYRAHVFLCMCGTGTKYRRKKAEKGSNAGINGGAERNTNFSHTQIEKTLSVHAGPRNLIALQHEVT